MNKLLIFLISLICLGCSKHIIIDPIPSNILLSPFKVSSVIEQEVAIGDMQINLSLDWIKRDMDDTSFNFINKEGNKIVFLGKEICNDSYNECMVSVLVGILQGDMNILSVKDIYVNNNKFLLVISDINQAKTWSWISYRNNLVYVFSCGGLREDSSNQEICDKIFNSLKFK